MPNIATSDLKQDAVLFSYTGDDNFGARQYSTTGVALKVRWQDVYKQVVDADGRLIGTVARVAVDRELSVGDALWKGKLKDVPADTTQLTNLKEVAVFNSSPDLKGRSTRRTAFLIKKSDKLNPPTS